MMIAKKIICLICVFTALLFQPHAVVAAVVREGISLTEVRVVLATSDVGSIVRVMNDIKQFNTPELSAFAVDLWKKNRSKYPELNWQVVASTRVRAELANILIQADNNEFVKVDRDEIRLFAREVLMSANEDAKRTCIFTLGLLNNPNDVSLLREIAEREDPRTFRSAAIALAKMCGNGAQDALKSIRLNIHGSENRQFLDTLGQDTAPYKRCK